MREGIHHGQGDVVDPVVEHLDHPRPRLPQRGDGDELGLEVQAEPTEVNALVRTLCDGSVSLPMARRDTGVDSFNVSVATGILLYEIMRQRGSAAADGTRR